MPLMWDDDASLTREQATLLDRMSEAGCVGCGQDSGTALWLRLSGGYGQFVDLSPTDVSSRWFAVCGRCLVAADGWLRSEWPWVPAGAAWMPLGECQDCRRNLPLTVGEANGHVLAEPDDVLTVDRAWGVLGREPGPHLLEPTQQSRLCHDCAHGFCEHHSWAQTLVDPYSSHAHTADFWAANPGHVGRDRPESG